MPIERLPSEKPILVTGASGFLALHVVRLLLAAGHPVRGTLRSPARGASLRDRLADAGVGVENLELVRADLEQDAGWPEALRGVDFVFHIASPLPDKPPRHVDEFVGPAKEGTLRVLRNAAEQGARRVVITSSVSAMVHAKPRDGTAVLTENDWSTLDESISAYDKSKTVAEQAAWTFVGQLPDGARFELVTIQPGFILGPSLDADHGTTNELVRKLANRALPGLPDLHFPIVHVLDVAELHVRAMIEPEAAGKRIACALPSIPISEVAKILADAGYRVPHRPLPGWLLRLAGIFDRQVAVVISELGKRDNFDCRRARDILGWKPRTAESAILDAASSLARAGLIERAARA
jgi:dihydroflavonol-4-reductase